MYKLDQKDRQILFELDCDSRQSINNLAKKTRLSRDVVSYRIKQLEKENLRIDIDDEPQTLPKKILKALNKAIKTTICNIWGRQPEAGLIPCFFISSICIAAIFF